MPLLNEFRFRSSPFVELKRLDDLAPEQRDPFRELERDPDFYGLFVAKAPLAMNLKSVSRESAELFQSLATPAGLDLDDDIIDLVLDGILEIETNDGFVSGADALTLLCPWLERTPHPPSAPSPLCGGEKALDGSLPREPSPPVFGGEKVPKADEGVVRVPVMGLSRDALLHAQDLETSDPQALTTALYLYNRIPMTPFWKTRFASGDAVLAHVGADGGSLRALLDREWIAGSTDRATGWLNWSSRTSMRRSADDVTYKLYVSPRPERIREAFEIVVRVLSEFPGTPFKIGDGAAGLLRPDKLVAYFATRELLDEAAGVLRRELAGCDAHGVPFTAGIDDDGLLSWGVDPPDSDRVLKWTGPRSWRLWVAQRLGAALAIAKSTGRGLPARAQPCGLEARTPLTEPWCFAIERARRHGVDVDTWTPSATLWSTT